MNVKIIMGSLIAALICFCTDGFLHNQLVKDEWLAAFTALNATAPGHDPSAFLYFGLFELGRGFLAIYIFGLLRKLGTPWGKAAFFGALGSWLCFSFTGPAQFVPLGFYPCSLWMKVAGFQLVTSILATFAGAQLVRRDAP